MLKAIIEAISTETPSLLESFAAEPTSSERTVRIVLAVVLLVLAYFFGHAVAAIVPPISFLPFVAVSSSASLSLDIVRSLLFAAVAVAIVIAVRQIIRSPSLPMIVLAPLVGIETVIRFMSSLFAAHGRDRFAKATTDAARLALAHEVIGDRPTFFVSIPADLRRSLAWDGRTIYGAEMTSLVARHLAPEHLISAMWIGGDRARRVTYLSTILLALATAAVVYQTSANTPFPSWAIEGGYYMTIAKWFLATVVNLAVSVAYAVGGVAMFAAGVFVATWIATTSRTMTAWFDRASATSTMPTRDRLLTWKSNGATREAQYAAYVRQVLDATTRLAAEPVISIGQAQGLLAMRGDLEAPMRGQTVATDLEALRQHVMIFGSTGSGKTRLAIRPLVERIAHSKIPEGHRLGFYVTDGKGTLHRDLMPSFSDRSDVVVLGTGAGEFGCDLLAGLSPVEVATTFRNVATQMGAGGGDQAFWLAGAELAILHAAVVAKFLDSGASDAEIDFPMNTRPFSLIGILEIATNPILLHDVLGKLIAEAKEASDKFENVPPADIEPSIAASFEEAAQEGADYLASYGEVAASVTWFKETWLTMSNDTRSGFIATINSILGKLPACGALADRFARGTYSRVADVGHALAGGVMAIGIGEAEWGSMGRLVAIWCKTRFYIAARRKLIEDPADCERTTVAMIADEYQMLVTVGEDADSSFLNISRQTGVLLIAATQSVAALYSRIDEKQANNILNLLRTKIVLKTEETSTLEFMSKLIGKTSRGFTVADRFFSTVAEREYFHPERVPEVEAVNGFIPYALDLSPRSIGSVHSYDDHLSQSIQLSKDGGNAAYVSQVSQEYTRFVDRNEKAITDTVSDRELVVWQEMLLGHGFALAMVQRAGGDRTDIIDLNA